MRPIALLLLSLPLLWSVSALSAGRALPPAQRLTQIHGEAALSETDFARLVGQSLSRYSARTEYEACAELCRAPQGAWSAQVLTIGSHAACVQTHECPVGTRSIGRGIHSHPIARRFQANAVDAQVWGKPAVANTWVEADDPSLFSESDFNEPGYLAVFGQLYFQAGPKKIKNLGSLTTPIAAVTTAAIAAD